MCTHRRNSWTVTPLLMVIALMGCGGGGGGEAGEATSDPGAAEKAAPAVVENAATLNVAVNFAGTAPAAKAIDMTEEKVCADKHTAAGGAKTEEVVVNAGKLQNVFVYVKDGLTGTYTAPAEKVTIDQDGCVYKPHVVGLMVDQPLSFKNSDGILHNIKSQPKENRPFNISQPSNMESERSFTTREVVVPVQCDVHGWMQSYVGVLDHPYFAVSGVDGGARIGNLPPGTYTIEAWHEKYGVKTQSVTVGPNETRDITFDFSAATATRVPLGEPIIVPHATHTTSHAGGR
ncbi:MAG: carboxypeptidase regulatory-like domain-containing protein [Longimicrobiales bacterium]